ncbi:CRE-DHS-2 protein [Aphelenchoides avenae]|nr:CRE-DHS-2 protein [Aphelenchus avenae]
MLDFLVGCTLSLLFLYYAITSLLERIRISDLSNKPVVITGCDTGFGFDLALRCVGEGMPVFAGCLTGQGKADLLEKAKTIRDGDRLLDAFLLDVRSQESVEKARDYVQSKLAPYKGLLHALVNNAGVTGNATVDDWMLPEDYQFAWEVNTLGVIRVTQAFKPFIKRARGRVVTTASICGRVALPGIGPYTTSKFAVEGYMDTIRHELCAYGVSVSILEPGFFQTTLLDVQRQVPMLERIWQRAPQAVRDEYGEEYLEGARRCLIQLLEGASPDTHLVIDAYFHALTSKFPRKRYQIGKDSVFFYIPLSMLPTRWQDWVFQLHSFVTGAHKPKYLSQVAL